MLDSYIGIFSQFCWQWSWLCLEKAYIVAGGYLFVIDVDV